MVITRSRSSWFVNTGASVFNTKSLQIHRESKTGDVVQLNMIHGTHYQAISRDSFAEGKIWGPWLWYLNNGSKSDAQSRYTMEEAAWPYKWLQDKAYQSRGKIQGKLRLSDGRPASGAAVFLGDDNNVTISTLDQGQGFYYTTYADSDGNFVIDNIRTGTYGLYVWGAGGDLNDVTTNFTHNNVVVGEGKTTDLKILTWPVTDFSRRIFQVGAFDRRTDSFGLSGPTPFEHGRIAKCPGNLTYTVGTNVPKDWCFGQSALGTWSIKFPVDNITSASTARLTVSLAGFSQGADADILLNGVKVGNITSSSLLNSQDTYRGATRSGEWRLLEFPIKAGSLTRGWNDLAFKVTKTTLWRGWLWDSVVLDRV